MSTDPSGLVAFLRARLDEDEQRINQVEEYGGCCSGCHCGCADPATRRADIAAKRRIIDEHPIEEVGDYEQTLAGENAQPYGCERCHEHDSLIIGLGYCETLRLLALPYIDRPGYKEEWRA